MNRKNGVRPQGRTSEIDTEGHRLLVIDRYGQRKPVRDPELERELRLRRQTKESRLNRPDRF